MVESLQDIRKKVARLIACKCTLAARVDSFHESPGGEIGEREWIIILCTMPFQVKIS